MDTDEQCRKPTNHGHTRIEPPDVWSFLNDQSIGEKCRGEHGSNQRAYPVFVQGFGGQNVRVVKFEDAQHTKDQNTDSRHDQNKIHFFFGFGSADNIETGSCNDSETQNHQNDGNRHASTEFASFECLFFFLGHRSGGPKAPQDHHGTQEIDAILQTKDQTHCGSRSQVKTDACGCKNYRQRRTPPAENEGTLAGWFFPTTISGHGF
mmetsp:Transcript_24237/g.67128  ORF Transcript_24237/g.67128 Transcript_24237/m.67128 type:complete len:207 (-) Transcript_24237:331-951(-)